MKRLIAMVVVVILMVCFSLPVYADKWTKEDMAWQGAALLAIGVDWLQTKEIARNDEYTETNPILGDYPSQNDVDLYFLGCGIVHTAISYYLPKKYRRYWQCVWVGIEVGHISHNINAGVRINF
ncbi:MAG: hypothetical protein PHH09_05880 [Methanoregulaceae archaeon]|nr:hypothetical protein [Methanoregulaceae archaeon]